MEVPSTPGAGPLVVRLPPNTVGNGTTTATPSMPGLGGALAIGAATTGGRPRERSLQYARTQSAPMPSYKGYLDKLRPEGTGMSTFKTKKWQRRYFKLAEGVLRWAHAPDSIDDDTPARVSLEGAKVVHSGNSLEFRLIPSKGVARASAKVREEYELRAVNAEEARRWSSLMDRSIQQLQWRKDIHSSGVFSETKGGSTGSFANTPIRAPAFTLSATYSADSAASARSSAGGGRTSDSSAPPGSPHLTAQLPADASAGVSARDLSLPPVGQEREGSGLTRLLSVGEIEPISVVSEKLQAYEDSKYFGATALNLLDKERRILKAADAREKGWVGMQKVLRLFLFNDMILIVQPYTDDMYLFKSLLPIEQLALQVDQEQLELEGEAASGKPEKWSVYFDSAAIAADWHNTIVDVVRRRQLSSSRAVTATPGSSQELTARTISFDDHEVTQVTMAGRLELQVQGSDRWLKVFAHARNGHLHFYDTEEDCPFTMTDGEEEHDDSGGGGNGGGGGGDGAPPPSPTPEVELTLAERLQRLGFPDGFIESISGSVTLDEVKDFSDDDEYWEELKATDPLHRKLTGMEEQWKNFTGSFQAILAASTDPAMDDLPRLVSMRSASGDLRPITLESPPVRSRSSEMSGLLMLGEKLSNQGLYQQSSSVVETALKHDPTDPMALQIRDELAACGHTVLLSINLAEVIGIENIELSAGTTHQQITIRRDEYGTFRLRPTAGTLERWYQQLHRVWMEAVSLLNTPKYDHCMRVSETTSKLVFEYHQAAEMFEGSWTPGERRDQQVASERAKYVEQKFQRAFAKVQPEQDASRWPEWIGGHTSNAQHNTISTVSDRDCLWLQQMRRRVLSRRRMSLWRSSRWRWRRLGATMRSLSGTQPSSTRGSG